MSPNTVHIGPDARAISATGAIVATKREPQRVGPAAVAGQRQLGKHQHVDAGGARGVDDVEVLAQIRRDVAAAPVAICATATSSDRMARSASSQA